MFNKHTPDSILSPREAPSFKGHPSANDSLKPATGDPEANTGPFKEDRQTSVVKWYKPTVGYGFLLNPSKKAGDPDIFLHATRLAKAGIKEATEGMKLSFVLRKDYKGREYAAHIKIEPQN